MPQVIHKLRGVVLSTNELVIRGQDKNLNTFYPDLK